MSAAAGRSFSNEERERARRLVLADLEPDDEEQQPPAGAAPRPGDALTRPGPLETELALSGWVDPAQITTGAGDPLALSRVVADCQVEKQDGGVRWLLGPSRRGCILNELVERGRLAAALADPGLPPPDPVGRWLRRALHEGSSLPLEGLDANDLHQLLVALEWLSAVDRRRVSLPEPGVVRVHLGRATAFDDYDILLDRPFVGRGAERAKLEAFLARPAAADGWMLWRGLVLSGSGGSGKSTLLARFVHDLTDPQRPAERRATVVLLDFDRPGMTPRNPVWLEAELSRQVAYQYPEFEARLRAARQEARGYAASVDVPSEMPSYDQESSFRSSRSPVLYAIREVLTAGPVRPLLLILDTFEEVVQADLAHALLESWLKEAADALIPVPVKVILSGRLIAGEDSATGARPVHPELPSALVRPEISREDRVNLGEFSTAEARTFLRNQELSDELARRVARSDLIPRCPLELKLLARVLKNAPSESTLDELEADLRAGGERAKELFVGVVFKRVLQRLEGDLVRKLAYPGLVLRYVTVELLEQVLIPALGLSSLSDPEAALNTMARYGWLAYRQGDRVWHRKDLRRSTLKAMVAQEREQAREISRLAVEYFRTRQVAADARRQEDGSAWNYLQSLQRASTSLGLTQESRDRLERLEEAVAEGNYHRLMLLDAPEEGTEFTLDELKWTAEKIGPDLVDLPPIAFALVEFARNGGRKRLSLAEVGLLPERHRNKAYFEVGRRLVRSREYGEAAELIRRARTDLQVPGRTMHNRWESEALFNTLEWDLLADQLLSFQPPPADRTSQLRRVADRLYLGEIVAPGSVTLPEVTSGLVLIAGDQKKLAADLRGSEKDDLLHRLAAGLLLFGERNGWTDRLRHAVRGLLDLLVQPQVGLRVGSPTTLHRFCLLWLAVEYQPEGDLLTLPMELEKGVALLRISRDWLESAAEAAGRVAGPSVDPMEVRRALTQPVRPSTGRLTVRALLRAIDGLRHTVKEAGTTLETGLVWAAASTNLPALFRGPDADWRVPCRYALLDAFPEADDHRCLGELIHALLPRGLVEFSASRFAREMEANTEHALEVYVEAIDRCWRLPELLERAAAERAGSGKLGRLNRAYQIWNSAVYRVLARRS